MHRLATLSAVLLVCCATSVTTFSQVKLLPWPREASFSGSTEFSANVAVAVPGRDAEDEFAAQDLEEAWKAASAAAARPVGKDAFHVDLLRSTSAAGKAELDKSGQGFSSAMQQEGYVLVVEPHQAYVIAASSAGIFYGVQTLKQLLPAPGGKPALATGVVRDWPAMEYRGIDDDLSRGPFPTLEFQKHQIRVFASFKVNVYSPYFEHTLLYPNNPLAAPPGSSLSPAEIAELVSYAKQHHVMVLPEQEAFGHLHQALKYDLYKDVAETPHGTVLAPGQPGALPLIQDWFTQIATEFPAPFLHLGADETFDLGAGLTQQQVKQRGYGPVYVDFLKQIHDQLAPLHRRLLFWGDIGGADPAAVAGLPKDMIAVPWNYWDTSGFDKMIAPFANAGMETWVAPGDANWNEVYPVAKTAFGNIQGFIRDGQKLGSTGALTTVWNDDGEGLFNMDWYGVLFGAVAGWQPGESSIDRYQDAYGEVFHGDSSGKVDEAEKELMGATAALASAKTGLTSDTVFFLDPWSRDGQAVSAKLLPVAVDLRTHAEKAIVLLEQVQAENPHLREQPALQAMDLGARRLDLIGLNFELAQEIADVYAKVLEMKDDPAKAEQSRNLLEEISSMFGRCQDIRDAYSAARDEYSQVWLGENRPYWLGNVTVRYDLRIQLWQQRAEQFRSAVSQMDNGRPLPPAFELGLPPSVK